MAKATIVTKINKFDDCNVFQTNTTCNLLIQEVNATTVKVLSSLYSNLFTAIETVVGCFHEESNFTSEIDNIFNCDKIKYILLPFNGAKLLVSSESTEFEVYQQWEEFEDANYFKKCNRQDLLDSKILFKDPVSIDVWYNYAKSTTSNIMDVARRLAKFMQTMLPTDSDVTIDDIAKAFSEATNIIELIPGSAHAIKILSQCWKYGDEIYQYYFIQNCCTN